MSVVALPTSVSVAAGSVSVVEPATAEAFRMVVPDVVPATISLPTLPAAPKVFAPVTLSALPKVIAVPDAAGPVRVTPSGIVRVEPVAGAVIATLLTVVAVATPMVGVISVGDVSTTNFVPVPVWLAIAVALPVDVITPVRLALVVTVSANAARSAYRFVTLVVLATVKGAVPVIIVLVITPVAEIVEKAPVLAVVLPIGPGAAKVAPPSVPALTAVLQEKPVEVV